MSFEKVVTVGILNGGGPDVVTPDISLPDLDTTKLCIEAWMSNFGGSNVHLLAGVLTLAEAQQRLERGFNDILFTVSGTGRVERRLPDNAQKFTVFFEGANNAGQAQLVTVRIYDPGFYRP